MMEEWILMVIASTHGGTDIEFLELRGQHTCENAKREVENADMPEDFNVVAVCFPKRIR